MCLLTVSTLSLDRLAHGANSRPLSIYPSLQPLYSLSPSPQPAVLLHTASARLPTIFTRTQSYSYPATSTRSWSKTRLVQAAGGLPNALVIRAMWRISQKVCRPSTSPATIPDGPASHNALQPTSSRPLSSTRQATILLLETRVAVSSCSSAMRWYAASMPHV